MFFPLSGVKTLKLDKLRCKEEEFDLVKARALMSTFVPVNIDDQSVLSRSNPSVFDTQRVEEVAHSLLAGRSNNLILFINQNHRERTRLVHVISIFGSVLLETVTLLANHNCKSLHVVL